MKYDLKNSYKVQCAKEYLNELILKKAHIELKEMKPKRSLDANGLYWLWLSCIEVETGLKKDEAHLMYRAMFLPKDEELILSIIRDDTWQTIKQLISLFNYFPQLPVIADIISHSTTSLDTAQFRQYLTNIRNHARTNMGLTLLTLEEKNFQDFFREYGYR